MNEKIMELSLAYGRAFEVLSLAYGRAFEVSIVATQKEAEAQREAEKARCKTAVALERLKKAIYEAHGFDYGSPQMKDVELIAGEKV
jgi:hypothetical protein